MLSFKKFVSILLSSLLFLGIIGVAPVQAAGETVVTLNTNPVYPNGFDPTVGQEMLFTYKVWGPADAEDLTIKIYKTTQGAICDTNNPPVSTPQPVVTRPAGTYTANWNGKDFAGKTALAGIYCYRVLWANAPLDIQGRLTFQEGLLVINQPQPPQQQPGGGAVTQPPNTGITTTNPCSGATTGPISHSVEPSTIDPYASEGTTASICYYVNQDLLNSSISIRIYDKDGFVVKDLVNFSQRVIPKGTWDTKPWSGKRNDGTIIPYGDYFYKIQISGQTIATGLIKVAKQGTSGGGSPPPGTNIVHFPDPGVILVDPTTNTTIQASRISCTVIKEFDGGLVIDLLSPGGQFVKLFYSKSGRIALGSCTGGFPLSWDGKLSNGQVAPQGTYEYRLLSNGQLIPGISTGPLIVQHVIQQQQQPQPQPSGPFIVSRRADPASFNPRNNEKTTLSYELGKNVTNFQLSVRNPSGPDEILVSQNTKLAGKYSNIWYGTFNGVKAGKGNYSFTLSAQGENTVFESVFVDEPLTPQASFITTFSAVPASFTPDNSEKTTITYTLGKNVTNFTLRVKNKNDATVATLVQATNKLAGTYIQEWNGKVNNVSLPVDAYSFVFEATGETPVPGVITLLSPQAQVTPLIIKDFFPSPNPFSPYDRGTTFRFQVNQDARAELIIEKNNTTVRRLLIPGISNNVTANVTKNVPWDGTDDRGKVVSDGTYDYTIQAATNNPQQLPQQSTPGQVIVVSGGITQGLQMEVTNLQANPNQFNADNQNTELQFTLNQAAAVTVTMYRADTNALVKTITTNQAFNSGLRSVIWDGKDSGNPPQPVPATLYKFTVSASSSQNQTSDTKSGFVSVIRGTGGTTPPTSQMDVTNLFADPTSFNPDNNQTTNLKFTLNQSANVTVTLQRLDNSFIRTLVSNQTLNAQQQSINWDSYDSGNPRQLLPAGTYKFIVSAMSTQNNTTDTESGLVTVTRTLATVLSMDVSNLLADPFNADTQNGQLRFYVNQNASVTITIRRADNDAFVRNLTINENFTTGQNSKMWRGDDQNGALLPAATYRFTIDAVSASNGTSDRDSGLVIVNRTSLGVGGQMDVYNLSANTFNADTQTGTLRFATNQNALVTITIRRADNDAFVRTVTSNEFFNSGANSKTWNGADQNNVYVPAGVYKFTVEATNTTYGYDKDTAFITVTRTGQVTPTQTLQITDSGPNPSTFNPHTGAKTQITFSTNMAPSSVKARVYNNINNAFIKELPVISLGPNLYRAEWDGREGGRNTFVPDDTYRYQIDVALGSQSVRKSGFVYVVSTGTIVYQTPTPTPIPLPVGDCANFDDVRTNHYLCPAVEFVASRGIFAGYADGTIKLDRVIQRAELLAVIQKAFKYPLDPYSPLADGDLGYKDLKNKTDAWYMPYIKTFSRLGLVAGYPDSRFRPTRTMNTAELYLVFLKAAKKSPVKVAKFKLEEHIVYRPPFSDTPINTPNQWYLTYAEFAQLNDLVTSDRFYPERGITRGQVIQLIYDTHRKGLISY